MKFDINIINHNYIVRIVIFTIYLFKNKRSDQDKYKFLVKAFLKKKISKDFEIYIDCGEKLNTTKHREILINQILYDENLDYNNLIEVSFKTPLKSISIQIDLSREDIYEDYLYL